MSRLIMTQQAMLDCFALFLGTRCSDVEGDALHRTIRCSKQLSPLRLGVTTQVVGGDGRFGRRASDPRQVP